MIVNEMLPVGTKVWTWASDPAKSPPFTLIPGVVTGHRGDWHLCDWTDPDGSRYPESMFAPMTSPEEARAAAKQVTDVVAKA